jgi:hypothetical protein
MATAFAFLARTFLGINKSTIAFSEKRTFTGLPNALTGNTIKMCKSLRHTLLYKSFTNYKHAPHSESVEEYTLECPNGLKAKIKELYPNGIIELDCSLGGQLIRHAYLNSDATVFKFYINPSAMYQKRMDLDGLVYLAPTDLSIAYQLQQTECASKGQWLLEMKDNKYIGVTERGIIYQSIDDWIVEVKKSCFEWAKCSTFAVHKRDSDRKKSIRQHFSAGKLDSWSLIKDVSYTEDDDYDKNVEMVEAFKSGDGLRIWAAFMASSRRSKSSTKLDKYCNIITNNLLDKC